VGSRTGYSDGRERPEGLPVSPGALREYIELVLICVLFIVFLRAFVFQQSDIPSGSMEDTVLVGDYVIVNRFSYAPVSFEWERRLLPIRGIRRGDVVVFKHPPGPERDFIKRVVGLPGESIEVRDGRLHVDGAPIEEPYLNPLYRKSGRFGPVRVPPGHYFLVGDHRNRSSDSRVWGPVAEELIKGRAFMVLFSTDGGTSPTDPTGKVTVVSVLRKAYDLVFHARWDRAFRFIR